MKTRPCYTLQADGQPKLRAVDDFTKSLINLFTIAFEKNRSDGLDALELAASALRKVVQVRSTCKDTSLKITAVCRASLRARYLAEKQT